jgi:ATP-binding cassette, subfamily B, bacterial HlyB/CyaB
MAAQATEPVRAQGISIAISQQHFLWVIGSLCQLHRIPFSAELLSGQMPGPYTSLSLVDAANTLGLKCDLRVERAEAVETWALPCIAFVRVSDASVSGQGSNLQAALIVRADAERVLLFRPGEAAVVMLTRAQFATDFTGHVFFAAPMAAATVDEDGAAAPSFGFRWFVPELLKHRTIWRDVLLGSLAIQLMALATPLFTQVVVDKVVVHRTFSTLVVIGVAMAVFMIFSAIMSWVRQYLILHTGNRIDAVLGSRVFEHLIKLPLRYYEHRPTGVVVARVQGVEQIREFLASAAVTLILDCPFLLIFLGIMFYYSVALTLWSLAVLAVIVALSLVVAPILRDRLNQQFLLGARNQAFLTEYVSGMETLKSLQLEPQLKGRFGELLASYLNAASRPGSSAMCTPAHTW